MNKLLFCFLMILPIAGNTANCEIADKVLCQKAEQGDADAQYAIGWMYSLGNGTKQDYQQALIWYQKAAEQGHADAQYSVGCMYHEGLGVEQNDILAEYWFRKAAKQGHEDAMWLLG